MESNRGGGGMRNLFGTKPAGGIIEGRGCSIFIRLRTGRQQWDGVEVSPGSERETVAGNATDPQMRILGCERRSILG